MRRYLLRHPVGCVIVAALALADVAWHARLRRPVRELLDGPWRR